MNKIVKLNDGYVCIPETGEQFNCVRWFEKKTNEWYIRLPKGNPTGREFIREKKFTGEEFVFETKTSGPRVLGASNWRAQLTPDELKELETAEQTIERLKELGKSRKPLTELERKEREIEELKRQLEELLKKGS